MKNRVILSALWITRISLALCVTIYLIILGMVVFWHLEPTYFENWYIAKPFHSGAANFNFHRSPTDVGMTLNDIGATMVYWLMFRATLFFALTFLGLQKVIGILVSLSNYQTFYANNIRQFRGLANIGFFFALLSFFNFGIINDDTIFHFSIPTAPILFTTACWVMAEIFMEGRRLQEDSSSII